MQDAVDPIASAEDETWKVIDGWNCDFCEDLDKVGPPPRPDPQRTTLDLVRGFFRFCTA